MGEVIEKLIHETRWDMDKVVIAKINEIIDYLNNNKKISLNVGEIEEIIDYNVNVREKLTIEEKEEIAQNIVDYLKGGR